MDNVFFTNVASDFYKYNLVSLLEQIAKEKQKMTYVLSKPLLETSNDGYQNGILVLIKGYKLIVLGFYDDENEFYDFCDDVEHDSF